MDILKGLNPEQRAAVEHDVGPMLVVAGAGTGKTQVITRRIAHLIQTGRAKPNEILGLTFTEKAAREMEERLYALVGWQSFQVPLMTFHAFGTELLSRYASHIGRSIRGGLLNDTQKALLLQQHLNRINLKYYGPQADLFEFMEGIVAYIGMLQNAAISVDDYEAFVERLRQDPRDAHPKDIDEQIDLAQLYSLYETLKRETGTFDYNDQLQIPLQILEQRPNLAERLAREYRYVLVDEYQDTNAIQDRLLRAFVGASGNIFAVGDDDQAIYGFRGAEIGNILAFAERYNLANPVVLGRNYRSAQVILDSAYRLIRNNDPERLESKLGLNKRLVALHDEGLTTFVPYHRAADEQQGVLLDIERRLREGERPQSIAVLASTHAPLTALAKAMRSRGMPFALSTAANIFEQPELLALWHLLRWLAWQADDVAIGHVIMGSMIGWTPEQYRRVLELSKERMITVEEALRQDDVALSKTLVQRLDEWRAWSRDLSISRLAFALIFDTGKADEWRKKATDSPRMIRVFEDLQRWLEQMQDFETISHDPSLAEYCRLFPKPPVLEVMEPMGDPEGVQLLTVHASKGLEFETVYLIGCTQRNWSGSRGGGARALPQGLRREVELPAEHELRRLMYVAVTRAKRTLTVSAATRTAGGSKQNVSPFVGELFGTEALGAEPVGVLPDKIDDVTTKLQQFYPMKSKETVERLPFETSDGWLELNVTALGAYEYCPFEFYLEHVLGIKHPLGPQLAFGNVLHKVLEAHLKGRLVGSRRQPEELHHLIDELWSNRGYERKELAHADRDLAHATLDRFLERAMVDEDQVLASELAIKFELPEAKLRMRGKIDAIFQIEDGVELRDFKTGRTKTDSEKLAKEAKENFQLRTYALAYELLKGDAPARVTLDYVVTGVVGTASLSKTILQNQRAKLAKLVDLIRSGEFAPNPSPMHVCAAIKYYGTGEYDELAETLMAARTEEVA